MYRIEFDTYRLQYLNVLVKYLIKSFAIEWNNATL